MSKENKMIAFKERSNTEQYYQDKDGNWIKTNESTINLLWLKKPLKVLK